MAEYKCKAHHIISCLLLLCHSYIQIFFAALCSQIFSTYSLRNVLSYSCPLKNLRSRNNIVTRLHKLSLMPITATELISLAYPRQLHPIRQKLQNTEA